MPTRSEAPPTGTASAGPRPDLRGYRLGFIALVDRPTAEIDARRTVALAGGLGVGAVIGAVLVAAGAPLLVAVVGAAIANLVVTLWLPTRLIEAADRQLFGVVHHLIGASVASWRRAYGSAPIPTTEPKQALWMAAQPPDTTDPDALATEASMLNLLGRYEDARERAERLPDDTPWWRFQRAIALAAIDFESGGRGDLAEATAAAEAIRGQRRAASIAHLALEDATRAMVRGDDWGPPIARAAAAARAPMTVGLSMALARVPPMRAWLLASEVALGVGLYALDRVL